MVKIIKDAANRYFASFVCEVEPITLKAINDGVGIDLGLTTFATLSTGEKVLSPKPLAKSLKRLRRAQKRFSRKVKGSNRRELARRQVARIHARISVKSGIPTPSGWGGMSTLRSLTLIPILQNLATK